QQFARLLYLPLVAPEAGGAHGGAGVPGFGLLLSGGVGGGLGGHFRFCPFLLRWFLRDLARYSIGGGFVPLFFGRFGKGQRFANATPSIIKLALFRMRDSQM